MRKWTGLVVLAFLMCVAVAAQGFGPMGGPMGGPGAKFLSEFKPVVGAWAEYYTTMEGAYLSTVRLAVVGKEGDAYWYEIEVHTGGTFYGPPGVTVNYGPEGTLVTKMLVSGDPQNSQNVMRIVIKANDEPALEVPVTAMAPPPTTGETDVPKEPEGAVADQGVESVTVPAGTFEANHVRFTQGETVTDVWIVAGIGPYGMVKSTSEDVEIFLTAYGSDATSRITETPTKFEMPMMPFGAPKGQ